MRKWKLIMKWTVIILIVIFCVIGVPIFINESYKRQGGYLTIWGAEDVLDYYGTIVGTTIAMITLVLTIRFTKKQIQRENFIQNEKEKWLKLDGIVMNILECISPAVPLQIYMDGGLVNPHGTIVALQKYQFYCRTCTDGLTPYLSDNDYLKMKDLINGMQKAMEEYSDLAGEYIKLLAQLMDLRSLSVVKDTLDTERANPGAFSAETIEFCNTLRNKTKELDYHRILKDIEKLSEKLADSYQEKYRQLLGLKGLKFAEINAEIQQNADRILSHI